MPKTMQVKIDREGYVHPVDPEAAVPEGGAVLAWPTSDVESSLYLSQTSLAEDWLKPEEDAAWAHLQPAS